MISSYKRPGSTCPIFIERLDPKNRICPKRFPAFTLITSGHLAAILAGQAILGNCLGAVPCTSSLLMVELFPVRIRYSASSLAYNLSTPCSGEPPRTPPPGSSPLPDHTLRQPSTSMQRPSSVSSASVSAHDCFDHRWNLSERAGQWQLATVPWTRLHHRSSQRGIDNTSQQFILLRFQLDAPAQHVKQVEQRRHQPHEPTSTALIDRLVDALRRCRSGAMIRCSPPRRTLGANVDRSDNPFVIFGSCPPFRTPPIAVR